MEKKNNHKNDDNEPVTKGYLRVTLKETIEEAFSAFAHKYIVPIYDKFAQIDKNFASVEREAKIFRTEVKSEFADVKIDIADIKKDVKDIKKTVEKHDKRITAVEDWVRIRP